MLFRSYPIIIDDMFMKILTYGQIRMRRERREALTRAIKIAAELPHTAYEMVILDKDQGVLSEFPNKIYNNESVCSRVHRARECGYFEGLAAVWKKLKEKPEDAAPDWLEKEVEEMIHVNESRQWFWHHSMDQEDEIRRYWDEAKEEHNKPPEKPKNPFPQIKWNKY